MNHFQSEHTNKEVLNFSKNSDCITKNRNLTFRKSTLASKNVMVLGLITKIVVTQKEKSFDTCSESWCRETRKISIEN